MAEPFRLDPAPIVEAIFDIHCDLSPKLNRGEFQSAAQKVFADQYPEFRTTVIHEQRLAVAPGKEPKSELRNSVRGYQSLSRDKRQIIQSRFDGFSFNRLTPYTTLDDYLPEIRRCWDAYTAFAEVAVVRRIALRYINRVLLPLTGGVVSLHEYLATAPNAPIGDGLRLNLLNFTHHLHFAQFGTHNMANVVLAAQPPEKDFLPVVLDIEAYSEVHLPPNDWQLFVPIIGSLRDLKNQLFRSTLKDKCLKFSPQPSH